MMSHFMLKRVLPRSPCAPYEWPLWQSEEFNLRVYSPKTGSYYSIYEGEQLMAKVAYLNLKLFCRDRYKICKSNKNSMSNLSDDFLVYENGKLIEKVDNLLQLDKYAMRLPLKNNRSILLTEQPYRLLNFDGESYFIDSVKVATESRGDGLIEWLIELVTQRKLRKWDPFHRIDYDKQNLSPLEALCLLVSSVAMTYD